MEKEEGDAIIKMDKKEITEYKATKEVKKIGSGAHVLLPRQLVGRKVNVELKK